jgi:hypothetical protein
MMMSRRGIFCAVVFGMMGLVLLAAPGMISRADARAGMNASGGQEQTANAGGRTPVLVELFTSEGCSDCPPADALLSKLDAQQPIANADVIVLELHVTYWDGDWRDRFSSSSYTQRQNMYAFGQKGDQMYTPQMVVDGGARFVGSKADVAQKAIEQAAHAAKAQVHLEWAGAAGGSERALKVKVDSLPAGAAADKAQVYLAVTENHLHSNVKAGENTGRSLDHTGVVRKLSSIGRVNSHGGDASFDAQSVVKLEKDWKPENLRAVVFVQDSKSLHVIGSAEIAY